MLLVLDNAPYHHSKCPNFVSLAGLRSAFLAQLAQVGITAMVLQCNGRSVNTTIRDRVGRKGPRSPSSNEIKAILSNYIAANPANQITHPQQIFESRDWGLIFTPSYTPEMQPIEKIWAYAKSYVARSFSIGRTMAKLIADVKEGFYGNEGATHQGVTADLSNKIINHSMDWDNQFIDQNMHEGGNLTTLAAYLYEEDEEIQADVQLNEIIVAEQQEMTEEIVDPFDFPAGDDE